MQQKMVLFPTGDLGVSELYTECLKFPNGKHDDAVDALSYIGILLNTLASHKPIVEEKKEGWKDKFLRDQMALQESSDGTTWMAS
jgi:hypothetical protein